MQNNPDFFALMRHVYFFKWANPGLFIVYFWSFQTNNTIFTTNQCIKMSCPSSIRHQDSNPQSLECESPPITTRPGLPPKRYYHPAAQSSNPTSTQCTLVSIYTVETGTVFVIGMIKG